MYGPTKRVIKLVLPTLCSPKKTSLNFLSGLLDAEKSPEVGVLGPDIALADAAMTCSGYAMRYAMRIIETVEYRGG